MLREKIMKIINNSVSKMPIDPFCPIGDTQDTLRITNPGNL